MNMIQNRWSYPNPEAGTFFRKAARSGVLPGFKTGFL